MPADLLQKINIPKAICYNKSVRPTYLRCRINAITIVLKYCMVLIRYHFGKNHKDPIMTKYLKHCRPFFWLPRVPETSDVPTHGASQIRRQQVDPVPKGCREL